MGKKRRSALYATGLAVLVAAPLACAAAFSGPAQACTDEPTPTATATPRGNPSGASFETEFSGSCDGLVGIVRNVGDGTSPGGEDYHLFRDHGASVDGTLEQLEPGDFFEVTMDFDGRGTYYWRVHRPFGHPGPEYITNKLRLNLTCNTPTATVVPSSTPTETPVPSSTSTTPTETPVPSSTSTTPTETLVPSSTPMTPTETSEPTETPMTPSATPHEPGLPYIILEKGWYDANGDPMPWLPPVETFVILAERDFGTAACRYGDVDDDGALESDELECEYHNSEPASDDIGLWVPLGGRYTISEVGLPAGFDPVGGVGEFIHGDGYCQPVPDGVPEHCIHVVRNQDPLYVPTPTPEGPTETSVPSSTPTSTPTATYTPTDTPTNTPTDTPTDTPEESTPYHTPTATSTPNGQPGGGELEYDDAIGSAHNLVSLLLIGSGLAAITGGIGYGLLGYIRRREEESSPPTGSVPLTGIDFWRTQVLDDE